MGYIYKITNNINQKIYIGLTTLSVEERWKSHLYTAFNKNSKDYNAVFKKAIRKYGENNFTIEVIDEAEDLDTLKEKEKYWIKYYNTFILDEDSWGYNGTKGGDSPTHEQDCIKVHKVNILTGEIIETYNSIAEAEKKYKRGICEIVNKTTNGQIPKGYTWIKAKEEYNQSELFARYNIVCQLDLQGNLIKYYLNAQDASEAVGCARGNISACLVNTRGQAGNYQWCYYSDLKQRINKPYVNQNGIKRQKRINQYDLCDNLIKEWDSMTEAAKATGTSITKISSVCNGKGKTANGFKWKFADVKES